MSIDSAKKQHHGRVVLASAFILLLLLAFALLNAGIAGAAPIAVASGSGGNGAQAVADRHTSYLSVDDTPTDTPTSVPTYTPTNTPVTTPTRTSCSTVGPQTATHTYTPTNTPVTTPTRTSCSTIPPETATYTYTPTYTPTPIVTPTRTSCSTIPPETATFTYTPTETPTPTVLTSTPTDTPINTVTNTSTDTAIPTPTVCTISFEDAPIGSTFYPYIFCMACRGIISGYACGGAGEPCNVTNDPYFRPGAKVTRGQFAKIAASAAGFNEATGAQQYQDMPPGSTFYDFVWRLSNRGFVSGYNCGGAGEPCVGPDNLPYFRPYANITRGQIAKIDSNAAGYTNPTGAQQFEDVPVGSTFFDYIWRLYDLGLVSGYPCGGAGEPCGPTNQPYFHPNSNATRGQASKIVSSTFFPECSVLQSAK